jgi:DNA-binding response OmpR family regulator
MSHILIYEPRRGRQEWCRTLAEEGHDVVIRAGRESLFDALAARRPDVIIYVLGDLPLDLGVLWVVRRIAPTLPIILLGGPAGLEARRSVQEVKPAYYGLFPLEPAELSDAVRSVLRHEHGRALAS